MRETEIKSLLKETYSFVEEQYGVHPIKDGTRVFSEQNAFESYVDSLSQGLSPRDEVMFRALANNLRVHILSEANITTNYSAYNQLLLPLLRVFFPRLVAREAVTVDTMDKPFVVKYFIKAVLKNAQGTKIGDVPDYSGVGSSGPIIPATTQVPVANGRGAANLIQSIGLTSGSLQRDVTIVSATDGADTVLLNAVPDNITGFVAVTVEYPTSGVSEVLHISVNWQNGDVSVVVAETTNPGGPTTTGVNFTGTVSMETNETTNEIELSYEPYQISAVSRKLKARWTIEFEQDVKALFDLDAQAQMLNLIGAQIATDIDTEIIKDLIQITSLSKTETFSKTPQAGFAFGPKQWYENIITKINYLSGWIYQQTAIAPGNTILCNPLDVAILQSTGEYSKTGDLTGGEYAGTTPYKIGELSNTYKVLVSQLVPEGKMIVLLKPEDPAASVYCYFSYIPVSVYPWPMGTIPAVTLMSRYAKRFFRPKGVTLLNITA